MDNGVVGSSQQVAETLSEIGYAGLGRRGPDAAKMSETLRQRGLRLFNLYSVLTIDDASEVLDDSMRQWIDSLENHDTALWISITKVIRDGKAIPLFFVSINGADGGDTQSMGWNRLIQTLDRGSYDVDRLLTTLRQIRYAGPIGLQGYNVPGDKTENLRKSMQAWQAMTATPSSDLPGEQ